MEKEFKPTWLYVKTHNTTGLKYFGKTCQKDPDKYTGSGTYWNLHIDKHGYDVTTEIIGYYTDKEECVRTALFLSEYWDIVKSDAWANLIPENGLRGGGVKGRKVLVETLQKMREKALARVAAGLCNLSKREDGTSIASEQVAAGLNAFSKRSDGSSITRDRIAAGTYVNPGQKREDGTCTASDRVAARTHHWLKRADGTSAGQEIALARSANGTNPFQNPVRKECPVCHKMVTPGVYARLHGDKCKMNSNSLVQFQEND